MIKNKDFGIHWIDQKNAHNYGGIYKIQINQETFHQIIIAQRTWLLPTL